MRMSDPQRCRVEIRAKRVGVVRAKDMLWARLKQFSGWSIPGARVTAYHLYLVYTNEHGRQYFYRGGPENDMPPFGRIVVESGHYVPGTIDWDESAISQALLSGPAAHGLDSCFETTIQQIAAMSVPYDIGGPNSNTVVRTLLENCGLPVVQPASVAPGFGHPSLLGEKRE